jgi:sensor c-di-GMP phosphodiesterase-like protein
MRKVQPTFTTRSAPFRGFSGRGGVTSIGKNIAAIVVGAVLAGAPTLAFYHWLDSLAMRQGENEVEASARRFVALAEARIGRAIATLDDLAELGVASCRADHVDALKRANFANGPVKEFSLVSPEGQTLCSDMETSVDNRALLASQTIPARPNMALDVIRIGDRGQRFVRIRRPATTGPNSLAALIPTELLIPQTPTQGAPVSANMRMALADGTFVDGRTATVEGRSADRFVSSQRSPHYGLGVTMSMPLSSIALQRSELHTLAFAVSAAVVLVIIAFLLLLPARRRNNPVDEIERAITAGEFIPYYQPIIDIGSGQLVAAEVLMRWRKRDGTIVPPAAFIPLAESSGLIVDMTRGLMRAVRDEMGPLLATRRYLRLSFNLSADHFVDERIVSDVQEIFEGSQMLMSQVVLEVTERQPLDNLTSARRVIAALQGLGARVAMDDVGAGHSGLSYMLKLGVDIIKIDKVFIDALGRDSNSTTIIGTLVDLARNMRMEIVAEGVENFEQVVALRDHGIKMAQGYVFAPPLPGSSFRRLVEATDAKRSPAASAHVMAGNSVAAAAAAG